MQNDLKTNFMFCLQNVISYDLFLDFGEKFDLFNEIPPCAFGNHGK